MLASGSIAGYGARIRGKRIVGTYPGPSRCIRATKPL